MRDVNGGLVGRSCEGCRRAGWADTAVGCAGRAAGLVGLGDGEAGEGCWGAVGRKSGK